MTGWADGGSGGYISTQQLWSLLHSHGTEMDPHRLDVLLSLAQSNSDGRIRYQDVLNLLSGKRSDSFRRAILQGNRRLCNNDLLEESGLSLTQRMIRHVACEVLPREIDRQWFYDNYRVCPPPWFIIAITIVEVAIFVYYGLVLDRFVLQVTHPEYLKNPLMYHPQLRSQAWRFLSYVFMHAGIEHLGVNVALQLLVGVPLEMVHGTVRIGFIYVAGVLAGSLAVSLADMTAPAVGSSGGVYAIVSAHLANIVMNWSGMRCQFKLLRMSFALIC
ncbi:rhomboid-related protein 3-like, partial [Mantella aurantiaca]